MAKVGVTDGVRARATVEDLEKGSIVRPGRLEDLQALTEIYNYYVRKTPVTFDVEPFSLEARRLWFDQFTDEGRYQLVVAENAGEVLGYACSVPFRPKPAYSTSVETSVYLIPEATERGIGTQLYSVLFERLESKDLHRAYAGITLPNPTSVALHTRFGFHSVGVYREVGRKHKRFWDVEWFEKPLE